MIRLVCDLENVVDEEEYEKVKKKTNDEHNLDKEKNINKNFHN